MAPYEILKCHRNRLLQRFMETRSATKRKTDQASFKLTEDIVEDTGQRISITSIKSARYLTVQGPV